MNENNTNASTVKMRCGVDTDLGDMNNKGLGGGDRDGDGGTKTVSRTVEDNVLIGGGRGHQRCMW